MFVRLFLLAACLAVSTSAMSQTGHPAKGSWAGFLEPVGSEVDRERVRLLIDAHNGELSGVVNPGRRGVEAERVELDASTWTLTIEADTPEGPLVLRGKLENLGSWTNRQYRGYYSRGEEEGGTFTITIN